MMQTPPKGKYVGHKVLKEGHVFFAVSDSDYVIEFKAGILKVQRLVDDKGQPMNAPDGMPAYWVQNSTSMVVLSKEEWAVRKQMLGNETA